MRDPTALRGATLVGTGSKVPDHVMTNADLEKLVDTSDEWIVTRTGIRERRVAAPGENTTDLAAAAARSALDMAGLTPLDVDKIIFATVTPDRILPSAACTLQEKLGATHAASFDLNAACSGFVYSLAVARGLIGASLADTVLVVGAECLSRVLDYTDRSTCIIFGDGAGAAVLRPCDPGHGILACRLRSDGTQGDMLEIPAGGAAMPATHATVDARAHFISMRGNELFKFSVRAMETVARHALEDAGISVERLKYLVPHQANVRILNAIAERMGLRPEQLVVNIERFGNTSAASIPISLDEVVRAGRLEKGDVIELVAFGGGVTWGALVLEWDPAAAYPLRSRAEQQPATAGVAAR
jgi:3-oxoacyl-[acyl-carrier-protein] synthase-3